MRIITICLALAGVVIVSHPSSGATIPGLFNTGLNDARQLLANGAVDPHYRLVQSADPASPGPSAFVVTDTLFPIVTGPWLASGPSSKWIAPKTDQSVGSASGDYRYRTTFDLTGLDPATAVLSGRWTSDNGGVDILINGLGTGITYDGNFGAFSATWTINAGFVDGTNTVDFVINNAGTTANPTAIRIELSGTADLPPPPGTPPTITQQPVSQTVALQDPATFSVSATGSRPLFFQWRQNQNPIAGATNAIHVIASTTGQSAGSYDVVVRNDGGSVTSAAATLSVLFSRPGQPGLEPPGPASRRTGLVISEIMYNPTNRADGRNGEFIELYNSNPYIEDISGWRMSGEVDFTFPGGTVIPGNGYLLVAPSPGDVEAIYGVTGVLGGFTNRLSNSGGALHLRKRSGGLVLEVDYNDQPPWPAAADGAGHSLVLARPSYGQADPRAWAASARKGGSPGAADPTPAAPTDHIVINEVLAHTDLPLTDYVELYNYSPFTVDLSGCLLSDDPATNKFRIADGTTVAAGGHVVFDQAQLGFALAADGETIYLVDAANTRVIDAVRFGGQANGISSGRSPDGAPNWAPLAARTPGAPNSRGAVSTVVINEILYRPLSGDGNDEFVELRNRGIVPVDLSGWKLAGGVSYTFPEGTIFPAGTYLVVAENANRLRTNYPGLNPALIFGNYNGSLANSGERIALTMPDVNLSTNITTGQVATNRFGIVVDEVTYGVGGRWGRWANGGGSSLELTDARANHQLAPGWADSDESAKAPWTVIEATGVLDLGFTGVSADQLQVMLMGPGEALLDSVEVLVAGSNRLPNPGFENGLTGWFPQGTHSKSVLETGGAFEGARCLHIVASERGDHVANRIRAPLSAVIPANTTVTLRARVRWLKGHPEILLRLRGGWLEASGRLTIPANPGTPGAPNSRLVANAGPAITEVNHRPLLPGAGQNIRVTARVDDPDGLQNVSLLYRLDPSAALTSVPMVDDGTGSDAMPGDGIYTGTIPGQAAGTLVAFYVQAADGFATPATSRFPNNAPGRECLVRIGEFVPPGALGTYRLWLTSGTVSTWAGREKMSNEDLDGTFVYGNSRVVYNVGAHFSGSSYTSPGYNSPVGNLCGYDINFPEDDSALGDTHFTLDWPIRDATDQREQLMFWFLEQYGLPNMYRRYVHVFVNGVRRGTIYDDVQQPGGDAVDEFYPNDASGSLWKTDCWNEFTDDGTRVDPCVLNSLEIFTSGGLKKAARYRWNWRPRAVGGTANDFTDLFSLIDVMNAPASAYQPSVRGLVDVEHWMRTFAMNDLASFWDAFGNPNAKNTYLYKPQHDGWKLFCWDFDVGLGVFNDPVDAGLFPTLNDPSMTRLYGTPAFVRGYWRALDEAVNSFFQASAVTPLLASKYAAFQASGVNLTSPFAVSGAYGLSITDWITQRRNYLLGQLATVAAPFNVSSPATITTANNLVRLAGTAPIVARDITINGIPYPISWTSVSNWTAFVPVSTHTTSLVVESRGSTNQVLGTRTVQVTYTGTDEAPETNVVINEIMYNPAESGGSYVELYNRSAAYSFDLGGWRLNGADYTFPPGTIITNGGYLVLARSREAFVAAYGAGVPVLGVFDGQLDNGGETLTLLRPAGAEGEFALVDRVTYDDDPPWPAAANGLGSSLQLIDATQDHNRPSNWGDGSGWQFFTYTGNVGSSSLTRLSFYFETTGGDVYVDDMSLVLGSVPAVGPNVLVNGGFESGLNPWIAGTIATNSEVISTLAHSGTSSLHLIITNGAAALTTFFQNVSGLTPSTNYTLSFWFYAGTSGTNLNIRLNTLFRSIATTVAARLTPGAANGGLASLPEFPPLWISEVQPVNLATLRDNAGQFDPWVEIYNGGLVPLSLDGMYLANSDADLLAWPFPPGTMINAGSYLLIWADGEPGQATAAAPHTTFRLAATNGTVLLSRNLAGTPQVLDYVNYGVIPADRSIGSFPDISPGAREVLYFATPGVANNPTAPPVPLVINEWMAANTSFGADPADGDFDDWFEIYNPGPVDVDLAGYRLTDDPANPDKFVVPSGIHVPAGGYLLVWADEETGQTRTNGDLHVNFKLSNSGEFITLTDPAGRTVDAISFGAQTANVTQGRFPDGAAPPFVALSAPTPRSANLLVTTGPTLEAVELIPGSLIGLNWSALPGRTYQLQFKNSLADAEWTTLPGTVTATGAIASRTEDISGGQRFYRIVLLP